MRAFALVGYNLLDILGILGHLNGLAFKLGDLLIEFFLFFHLLETHELVETILDRDLTHEDPLLVFKDFSDFLEILVHVHVHLVHIVLENIVAVEGQIEAGVEHLGAVFKLGLAVVLFELVHQTGVDVTGLVSIVACFMELISVGVFIKIFGELHIDFREFLDLV